MRKWVEICDHCGVVIKEIIHSNTVDLGHKRVTFTDECPDCSTPEARHKRCEEWRRRLEELGFSFDSRGVAQFVKR